MDCQHSENNNPMTTTATTAAAPYLTVAACQYYPTPATDYLTPSELSPMENEFVNSSAWEIPSSTWIGSRPEVEMLYYHTTHAGLPTLGASSLITTTFPCKFTPPETGLTSHDTMLYYTASTSPSLSSSCKDLVTTTADAGLHQCRWLKCPLSYVTLDELIVHIREDHVGSGKPAYFCFWAGCPRHRKPFTKRHKMHNHMRTHTGERPFVCTIPNCGKRFSRPDSLTTHIKTHSNIRPYHCKVPGCSKAYFHSRSLRKHTRSHEQKDTVAVAAASRVSSMTSILSLSSSSSHFPHSDQRFFPMADLSPLPPL